ncbi:Crp/Fnr family transcriptional regulator [Winogradskyella jejuensis]|uniref:cAMP-binding domain of CRP or a regulatory subunit of cAMP-dependent protein kinases n=1 Tax=Winogradskyella jejuensis TaxID=1089305 RepID=A0A1M5S715_9FLAO|nr:Crp/Fnr family transcriptional regulator [Winogradskyella jejuensis]SHH34235.1 cAMP-binding domain of CRP or a regulatory subunit of cAMP-dependent protein kinases [Winogradskyella jejuensis]
MKANNSIIQLLLKGLSLSKSEIEITEPLFQKVFYEKGALLLRTNDIVNYQYYTLEGCLRSFYLDKYGKEHTLQFAIRDWWISDYTGFFSDSKAILNIEVIEDAILYRISKENKERLYSKIPKIESFFRKKLENAFAAFQKRILANISQTATERYLNFINTYPDIEKSVKNYHIASYLGITTESLSRIRKEISMS